MVIFLNKFIYHRDTEDTEVKVDNNLERRLLCETDASPSNHYNTRHCWQPYNSLLAGNDIFRRGRYLSGPADRSGSIPEAN